MLTIWGRANSINVQKVLWCCTELNLAYQRHDLGGPYGGLDTSAFLAMNPNGKIPAVQDGDLVVWESHAILRYLGAAYGAGSLWPEDPKARAPMESWLDWAHTEAYFHLRDIFFHKVRLPEAERDPALAAMRLKDLTPRMAMLATAVGDGPYLLGERFSLADIPAALILDRWYKMDIERVELPALDDYYDRLCARPAYALHSAGPLT